MKKIVLVLLLLSACSPRQQEYTAPAAPPQLEAHAFLPGDGAELPLRRWRVAGQPRAVVLALHGFNDYSHAFEKAAQYFARRGIETYAYDQRGFGASPGRGIWADEQNLISDMKQAVRALQAKYPGVPMFLLGESMGSAVIVEALASENPPRVKGVILSGPAVWGGPYFIPPLRVSLWLGAHLIPYHELTGRGLHVQASDNIPMLMALGRDPLVIKSTRVDAVYGLMHLMDHAYTDAEKLSVPSLVLYGEHDQIIPASPVKAFAKRLPPGHTFVLYPDGWHMLMRDLEAKRVWKDEADWMLAHARGGKP